MTARALAAQPFMTPAAYAALPIDPSWWSTQVVPEQATATCSQVRADRADAPAGLTIVRISAVRTVVSAGGFSATEEVLDQRQMVQDALGRWLVDMPAEGG